MLGERDRLIPLTLDTFSPLFVGVEVAGVEAVEVEGTDVTAFSPLFVGVEVAG